MLQKSKPRNGWRPAATSCVRPDTAAANCRQLVGVVPEVGLYLLELVSCLAYGPDDLPRDTLGLTYHLHLPIDLPWHLGGDAVFAVTAGLLDKTAHLAPWGFVLHPPVRSDALRRFLAAWTAGGHDPAAVLLENTEEASPEAVVAMAREAGCSVCLDLGHMLAMGHALPDPACADLVRMLHLYAPWGAAGPPSGKRHIHASLAVLDGPGGEALAWMAGQFAPEVVVAEVFSPEALRESLTVLEGLDWGRAARPAPGAGA